MAEVRRRCRIQGSGVISTGKPNRLETTMTPKPILPLCVCGDPACTIPYGLCHCGCERKTGICTHTDRKHGRIEGFPSKYVVGHATVKRRHAVVQPDDASIRYVPLTRGQTATLSAADYVRLSKYRYYALWSEDMQSYYAYRTITVSPNKRIARAMHVDVCKPPKGMLVDHINGNTLDNRRSNLRPGTALLNAQNRQARYKNKTGYTGVVRDKRCRTTPFHAHIRFNGKTIDLGYFATAKEASCAYEDAKVKLHGDNRRKDS